MAKKSKKSAAPVAAEAAKSKKSASIPAAAAVVETKQTAPAAVTTVIAAETKPEMKVEPVKSAPAKAAPAAAVPAAAVPARAAKPTTEMVSARAHQIWIDEGRPAGKSLDHWVRAERELGA